VEYALRATVYIAAQSPRAVRIPEIANAVSAPANYLSKILGKLARAGILRSMRGPTGGFRVAARRERASLAAIVAVFEPFTRHRCLLGRGMCGQNPSCAVHERWAPIAQSTTDFFAHTTIADLLSTRTPS
jgi:Rrf2 family protein